MEEEVEVDPKYHKFFIQRRGQVRVRPFVQCMVVSVCRRKPSDVNAKYK